MKYALIDMGSNSIRLTVYDLKKDGFQVLFKEKFMAGLAGYVEHGRLTQDGISCACQSLKEFQNTVELLEIGGLPAQHLQHCRGGGADLPGHRHLRGGADR